MQPVVTPDVLARLRETLDGILVRDELVAYLVDPVRGTRKHRSVVEGIFTTRVKLPRPQRVDNIFPFTSCISLHDRYSLRLQAL